MPSSEQPALWTTFPPATWPKPPEDMTVSALREIEACPRRWSLASAEYPELWTGRGYPPRLQLSSLAGSVVHLVLETLTKELIRAGCPTVRDETATQVMRALGGYTKVVNDCIDRVVARFAGNPRATHLLDNAVGSLRAKAPELRAQAQLFLGRVGLPPVGKRGAQVAVGGRHGALLKGVYTEVELRARQMAWKARADLMVLSEEICEIIDFKTGLEDDRHGFQLQVYALIWNRDPDLNPSGRRADRLILAYPRRDIEVAAPSAVQLDALEQAVLLRGNSARRAVSSWPPEARPTQENCCFCEVRQLCDRYWAAETQSALGKAPRLVGTPFEDFELTITDRHGPSSWNAIVTASRSSAPGRQVLLRAREGIPTFRPGQRIRLLDAYMSPTLGGDEMPLVATMGTLSEAYTVS
jgi:hypothetical protein